MVCDVCVWLQLIAFVDALLNCEKQPVKRVLILCPVNTIYNWRTEFFKWIAFKDMEYNVRHTDRHLHPTHLTWCVCWVCMVNVRCVYGGF